MCGRYTLLDEQQGIEDQFSVLIEGAMPPRYNIAPTQPIVVIKAPEASRDKMSNLPPHDSALVRWGFIPSFVRQPENWPLTINIRAETVAEKKSFRNALNYKRVIIPASGFFEWHKGTGKKAQPYYITPKFGGLFGFAGLMETWSGANGSEVDTAAIITSAANDELKNIHRRMPVILERKDYARWLDVRYWRAQDVLDCLKPARAGQVDMVPVSDKVNDTRYMREDVLEPCEVTIEEQQRKKKPKPDDGQMSFF